MTRFSHNPAALLEPMVAAAKAAGNHRALLQLAEQAHASDQHERGVELLEELLAIPGIDPALAMTAQDRLASKMPRYHVRMIRDAPRNQAFEAALRRAVTPQTRVLDVGSGTGLLAMMAARAGAAAVYSCEVNPAMARVASEIVTANGFADTVTIIGKHSSALDAEADLGGPVDLVVAEIIGMDLVNEGVLPAMRDVVRRLAKPGARMIPQSGEIRVALGWWDGLAARAMRHECGFDMSAFNRLLRPKQTLRIGDPQLFIRGEEASLFSFDFSATEPAPERAEIDLLASGGKVNGVVQWLRLQMDEAESFDNRPAHGATSSWYCGFYPLARPIDAVPGEIVRVAASHAGNLFNVWQAES